MTITNKTQRPVAVPLPGGRKLYLGPGQEGRVIATAVQHPQLVKLVDAGTIEVIDDGASATDGLSAAGRRRGALPEHAGSLGRHRSGDR